MKEKLYKFIVTQEVLNLPQITNKQAVVQLSSLTILYNGIELDCNFDVKALLYCLINIKRWNHLKMQRNK